MEPTVRAATHIEAELHAPSARVSLVHYYFAEPPDRPLPVADRFRVELYLTPRHRSARASFPAHWSPRRFERLGALFVVPPDQEMIARSDEKASLTSIVCELKTEPLLELFETIPQLTDQHLSACLDVHDTQVRNLLLRLAAEGRHPGFASEILVESIATQMVVELFRHGNTLTERSAHGGLAPWQLRVIDERLNQVCETPSLRVLAALCRLSVRQLTRAFRVSRGCSIGAYVAQSQMEHAKRLLAKDECLASIANTLGFSTSSNFCFAFRRTLGMTPGRFRQMLGQNK
jgi:AraC family transcriptional regulator